MKKCILLVLLCSSVIRAESRLWTYANGKELDAEVVWVNERKNVKLRTPTDDCLVLPFSAFTDENIEYLESLLLRKQLGGLHPVPWSEMNTLFGLDIWQDFYLWDDVTSTAAERMKLEKESQTDFMENHRAYPLGEEQILSEPVFTTVLYGGEKTVESLCFVFLNQGDIPLPNRELNRDDIREISRKIEESGDHVYNAIVAVLGEPERDTIGRGNMREDVRRWDWNGHAILLTTQEGKYAMVRILPPEKAGEIEPVNSRELRDRMAACVERRKNDDVVINNIPMIDQGPKGYCSPATWERYLRYLSIPADMYQLALIGNTDIGGGTYAGDMIDATQHLLAVNGRSLKDVGSDLEIDTVAEYIDEGMPIMWSFTSSPRFQLNATKNTLLRNGKDLTRDEEEEILQNSGTGGHICLIIGYNKATDEIAISDSWGPAFAERWIRIDDIDSMLFRFYSQMSVIKW